MESECKKFKVKLTKPKNVKQFLDSIQVIRDEKRKAENVLLDEIEQDVFSKEKFITEQVATLTEMQESLNTLIEHKNVISVAAQVVATALAAGAEVGADEEKKEQNQIELQNLSQEGESRGVQEEGANAVNSSPARTPVQEQQEPLLQKQTLAQPALSSGLIAISYLAGTINKSEIMRFRKIVYRTTRGKALAYFNDLDASGL